MFSWQHLIELSGSPAFEHGVEANGPLSQRFLVKLAQLPELSKRSGLSKSVVLSVVDLSVSMALDEARDRTLSFLSHDLRAPQVNILALLELESEVSSDNEELFARLKFQAERTLQLAEGFVQLSQASHGVSYNLVEYNLNDLIVEALDEQWASASQKKVALRGENSEDVFWAKIDRNLLWRAIVNLISNAVTACTRNAVPGGEITLTLRRENQFGVIAICDNGPGISATQQINLFQPFVQGKGLRRTGAGLGLAFVKVVMDQHHGQVRVISPMFQSPNLHGTQFELWVPLMDDTVRAMVGATEPDLE
jgi:signal transduction histidine kinase